MAPDSSAELTTLQDASPSTPVRRRITILGDYRLDKKIGAGAMGYVYRAWQISKKRAVAVKVLRSNLATNPIFLERFRREADAMARLSHPNIIRCFGVGKQQGRHYLAMELVAGCSLGDWLYRLGKLSVGDSVHLALMIARALQYAHQNGLVHRDIKPDNILITPEGGVKVADLGLAKGVLEEDQPGSQAGHGVGTPIYMAPEQARNAREADPRSDLYALGCVLYHLLTGQFPFRGENSLDIILAKIKGVYRSAREVNPDIPKELDAVLAVLLASDPEDRYQSASDLVLELEELQLANARLGFLQEGADKPPPCQAAHSNGLTSTKDDRSWRVEFRTQGGRWVTEQLSTSQILLAMEDRQFAATARARQPRGEPLQISEIPEIQLRLAASQEHVDQVVHRRHLRRARRWGRLGLITLCLLVAIVGFLTGLLLIP